MLKPIFHCLLLFVACLFVLTPYRGLAQCGCDHVIDPGTVYINGNDPAFNYAPGDVVCITASTKSELWILNVHGAPGNPVTFKNCGGQVILQQPNLYSYVLKISDSDNIRFTGSGDSGFTHGIQIIGEGAFNSGSGIELDGIYNQIELDHLEIFNNEFAGIWAKEMDFNCGFHRGNFTLFDLKIHDNYIHDVGTEAIYISRQNANYATSSINCGGTHVYPYGLEGLRIYNNLIERTGWDGMDIHGANWDCEIYNNTIRDYGLEGDPGQQKGIFLEDGSSGLCYNNLLQNGGGDGIVVMGWGTNKIFNNVIENTGKAGILCRERIAPNYGEFVILHNTIINPGLDGIIINSVITGNYIYNNLVINPSNIEFITLGNGATATIDGNYLDMDITNVQFADGVSGDYHLANNSPLIDQAANIPNPNHQIIIDHTDNARPANGTSDIGAFEFQGTAGTPISPTIPGPPPFTALNPNSIPTYNTDFLYGSNVGFYPGWTDEQLADIAAGNPALGQDGIGVGSFRPALPEHLVEQFGYKVRIDAFEHYASLGMQDHTMFIGFPADGSTHRDPNSYCPDNTQSWLFDNMYENIWDNGEGGTPVNENNYFAHYVWKLVYLYKDYVKFWQVINEPDFDGGGSGWFPPASEDPAFAATNWWDNDPNPCELANMEAPVQHYIRMLRITYEIVKSLAPDDYVSLGGIAYPSFLDALLRHTDNPGWYNPEGIGAPGSVDATLYPLTGGAYFDVVTFHLYPQFSDAVRFHDGAQFVYNRHSDAAASSIIDMKAGFETVLQNRGFDGITHPEKFFTITEMNISRRPFPYEDPGSAGQNYIGGDEVQRNFIMKTLVQAQMSDIKQLYFFNLGDEEFEWEATGSFNLMGFYQKLGGITPYSQLINSSGIAFKTMATELKGYAYDPAQTVTMALPSGVKGAAFIDDSGNKKYVLWAETIFDESEFATAVYSFPVSFGYIDQKLIRKAWDNSTNPNPQLISGDNIALTGAPIVLEAVDNTPFPVEFLNFTATPVRNKVALEWTTAWEQSNAYFNVERSADARLFETLLQVPSQGNSSDPQQYYADDLFPYEGSSFYRLKQIDLDGTFSYSQTVEVNFQPDNSVQWEVFPNPVQQNTDISLLLSLPSKTYSHLSLWNALGQQVWEKDLRLPKGEQRLAIPTNDMPPGNYFLMFRDANYVSPGFLFSRQIVIY